MVLNTQSMKGNLVDKDNTPEYEVRLDFEGKGYLARKEEVKEEVKEVSKKKVKRGKK